LVGGEWKSPKGREGGDGGERTRLKLRIGERKLFHRGQRYLYLNNPESPGQVQSIWKIRTDPGDSAPPESSEQIFKEFDFVEIWNIAYVIYVSLSSINILD
jgi:hypothetical protein